MICIRENSEGEYAGIGGRLHVGTPHEVAEQTGVFTRRGVERVARFAFDLASRRPRRRLASATKSNALQHSMVLWDDAVESVATSYPTVEWRKYHVDALAARMVTDPGSLDVIVASNLFGDILTDLGAAVSGSLGVAPGANIDPGAPASVDVRADSRIRAGHRGTRHRQSDRRDMGRRADAGPPRHRVRARPHRARHRACRRWRRTTHTRSRGKGDDEGRGGRDRGRAGVTHRRGALIANWYVLRLLKKGLEPQSLPL